MPKNSSIRSSVSIELRLVTDRQTDRHRVVAITRAGIASRGNKTDKRDVPTLTTSTGSSAPSARDLDTRTSRSPWPAFKVETRKEARSLTRTPVGWTPRPDIAHLLTSTTANTATTRTLTTWHCPHSHAAAAPIDRYLLPAGPSAANLQQRVCCRGSVLGQTDGRTPYRFIDPAPRTTRAAPMMKCANVFTGNLFGRYSKMAKGGSVAEWLACWTQAQKGPGSNRSRDAVG